MWYTFSLSFCLVSFGFVLWKVKSYNYWVHARYIYINIMMSIVWMDWLNWENWPKVRERKESQIITKRCGHVAKVTLDACFTACLRAFVRWEQHLTNNGTRVLLLLLHLLYYPSSILGTSSRMSVTITTTTTTTIEREAVNIVPSGPIVCVCVFAPLLLYQLTYDSWHLPHCHFQWFDDDESLLIAPWRGHVYL